VLYLKLPNAKLSTCINQYTRHIRVYICQGFTNHIQIDKNDFIFDLIFNQTILMVLSLKLHKQSKSISPIIEINGSGKNHINIAIFYNRIVKSLVIKCSNS